MRTRFLILVFFIHIVAYSQQDTVYLVRSGEWVAMSRDDYNGLEANKGVVTDFVITSVGAIIKSMTGSGVSLRHIRAVNKMAKVYARINRQLNDGKLTQPQHEVLTKLLNSINAVD